jgi:hypothetical protein
MEILVSKQEEGGVKVYFDIPIINWNIFPREGAFPNQKTRTLVESFATFGVASSGLPEYTRIYISNVLENKKEIDKAKKILAHLIELINTSGPAHQKTTYEIAQEEQVKSFKTKAKEIRLGTHYRSERKDKFNKIVFESFEILKFHNADPAEWSADKFNVMNLNNGFFSPSSQVIEGVINLYEFALKYDLKQSAKNNNKPYSKRNLNTIVGFPSIDDFETELEYFNYIKKNQHPSEKHWYKVKTGIGGKDTNIFFENHLIKSDSGGLKGYWIQASMGAYCYIFGSDLEVIGIDYQNNIFLSLCPKCRVKCKGKVFSYVEIKCTKCGCSWKQHVD